MSYVLGGDRLVRTRSIGRADGGQLTRTRVHMHCLVHVKEVLRVSNLLDEFLPLRLDQQQGFRYVEQSLP